MVRRGLVVVVAALAAHGVAYANDTALILDYRGDCDASQLRVRTHELVGHDPFSDDGARTIRVEVSEGARVTVEVALLDAGTVRATRRFEGATCEESLRSAALVIAMVLAQPRVATPPPVQRADLERPPATAYREELVARGEVRAPSFDAGLVLGGAVSSRGEVGWTFGIQLGTRDKTLELAVEGRPTHSVDLSTQRVEIAQLSGSLTPCLRRGRVSACVLAAAGTISARITELGRTATSPFAALGSRLAWEQRMTPRFALRAQIAGRLALTKTRFWLDGMPVWESPRAELWSGIVMVARFP